MRILDLQRRLREIGRIRIGEKVEARNQKGETVYRPSKIDRFRFTSRNQRAIEAAAEVWGGKVTPWEDAPDGPQWQVYLTAKEIPVVVPPGDMSFSQSYEQWSRGGCKVRCDGRWDHQGDKACHCDPTARACDIHSRLSLILPDVPGLGMWRLDTQSYYAAVELGGVVDLCAAQSAQGVMLPARLGLEQRSVKRMVNGKPQTRRFVVPVLNLDIHPLALSGGTNLATGEIGQAVAGELEAPKLLTPVPPSDGSLAPTVAEQLAAIDAPSKVQRANAAQPIPATGLRPRTAAEAEVPDGYVLKNAAMESLLAAVGDDKALARKAWDAASPEVKELTAGVLVVSDVEAEAARVEAARIMEALDEGVAEAEAGDAAGEIAAQDQTREYAPDDPERPFDPAENEKPWPDPDTGVEF